VCAARLGMVAIVLPAPKPGPDETSRATEPLMLRLRATALSLEDPYAQAPDGFGDDDLSDLSDLEVEAVAEAPAPGEAEAESPAEGTPAESGSDVIPGAAAPEGPSCSSTGDGSPTGLAGMALLLALGLVRRRLGGGR
jgi:MYXO-CTERM domain-containing protein